MTDVHELDEDELLNDFINDNPSFSADDVDEDLLLNGGPVSRSTTLEFEPEPKPLVTAVAAANVTTEEISSEPPESGKEREHDEIDNELDYDEEDDREEKEERTGKFTSERVVEVKSEPSHVKNQGAEESGQRQSLNDSHRGRGGFRGRGRYRGGHQGPFYPPRGGPYNAGAAIPPPPLLGGPPGQFVGGKILVNPKFRGTPPPLVRLQLEGQPPQVILPSMGRGLLPPSSGLPSLMGGPIIPRLPNGIPLTPLPPNHGVAGFGPSSMSRPPPGIPQHLAGAAFNPAHPPPVNGAQLPQWDQAVAAFLNQSSAPSSSGVDDRHRGSGRHRSPSYSSYSSSYSDSYSDSSRSRSRSRTRSRSPRRRRRSSRDRGERKHRSSDRAVGGRDKEYGVSSNWRRGEGTRIRGRRDDGRRGSDRGSRRDDKEATIEHAKAIGLDEEYVRRMEEQKRKREEIVRQKEQRRFVDVKDEPRGREAASSSDSRTRQFETKREQEQPRKSRDERREGERERDVRRQPVTAPASATTAAVQEKKKAYLCVVISNLKQLPTAKKRIEALASDLGDIKKCWRSSEDTITVIFADLEKAKQFLVKYNGKVLSGLRIQVTLEKQFHHLVDVQDVC